MASFTPIVPAPVTLNTALLSWLQMAGLVALIVVCYALADA